MALITCPACGKQVSENANACPNCGEPIAQIKLSGIVDSGSETFFVQGNNRIELSANANAQINARTARLSSEGKNVVNIQKSEPQPFSFGVTVWKMDIVIIWNASLDSPVYKQFLYSSAQSLMSDGQYSYAKRIFNKLNNYKDSNQLMQQCQEAFQSVGNSKKSISYTPFIILGVICEPVKKSL